MNIRKRTGEVVPFQEEKILNAMKKAFSGQAQELDDRVLDEMLSVVLKRLPENGGLTVERVQDEVERVLMECGHYEVAKAYILYREKRAALRRIRADLAREVGDDALEDVLRQIQKDYEEEVYPLSALQLKFESFCKPAMTTDAKMEALIKAAVELTTVEAPKWEFIAARLLNHTFSKRNASRWTERGVKGLYEKLRYLTDKGLYGDYILARYSREEIDTAEGFLCPERDTLFTYSGLDLLLKRYVIQSRSREPLETPQEMFLGIALHLAMNEASDRMGWVRRFYDMLSRMEVTMATPTMSNARKPHHQLSSCFIDTVPDSLDGIYRSVDNFAKVSKFGGGMGLYFGKVRATGSAIRGFQGAAGGVIRWIRLVNDTAVAVDQLGMRQGAVAVYLDAWHKDLPEFLQLRTNNGDDRMKAHDVFPAVCYPDLFWKLAEKNLDAPWHLMCPHDILTVKGYALEDYWGEEWEKRYLDCVSKVRATGSAIRGFQGAAGGVIRWIRLVNDTAVAVDQLGMRQGAVAVYLDAWHKDLPEFLQLRTNNGDDRMKAHDVFPAVCYPDLFWKLAEKNLDAPWHLMCPHDILTVKGYALEDYWGEEWEKRYLDCVSDPRIEKRTVTVKDIVRLVLRSAVETGTPFAFNRDVVNRMNPNGHAGMIYCSNLCTEIAQNMAPIEHISTSVQTENGDTVVVTVTRPGEFVVCNLASLSLGNLPVEDEAYLERTVETAIRALDNVIDLNFYPLEYARLTNHKYRSIGLGVSGYHHMLAKRGIRWESEEHLAFADAVFERINYAAIRADTALAREKGCYALFEGSDWQTGAYFEKRGYASDKWRELAETVAAQGMRNAYLLAVAPTSSTSILSGTSAGIDPVMRRFFLEEKKGSILPRVAPELSLDTWWYYKAAHLIDQSWSVRAAGVRQRHIDQAQSMNLYITNDYTMRQVLALYLDAWRSGVKTIYYIRSKSLEVEDCESCAS